MGGNPNALSKSCGDIYRNRSVIDLSQKRKTMQSYYSQPNSSRCGMPIFRILSRKIIKRYFQCASQLHGGFVTWRSPSALNVADSVGLYIRFLRKLVDGQKSSFTPILESRRHALLLGIQVSSLLYPKFIQNQYKIRVKSGILKISLTPYRLLCYYTPITKPIQSHSKKWFLIVARP